MFHVEQIVSLITIAGLHLPAMANTESVSYMAPALTFPVSSDSEKAVQSCQAGLLDLILGWDESALLHFNEAISIDQNCVLAYAGKAVVDKKAELNRDKFRQIISQSYLLPQETFFVENLLLLSSGHYNEACRQLCERADTYRADKVAGVWATILLHSQDLAYHPETGEPGIYQKQALKRIQQLRERFPNDGLIAFARAYIEESAPTVSQEALKSAQQACDAMPQHPVPHLLMGFLLQRTNQHQKAVDCFQRAGLLSAKRGIALEDSPLWWKARLSEATAQFSAGNTIQSFQLVKILNSRHVQEDLKLTEVGILQRWEVSTLALRFLVAQSEVPSQQEITNAAKFAATPHTWKSGDDPVLSVRDCLRASLSARLKMKNNQIHQAQRSLALAEKALKELEQQFPKLADASPLLITPFYRAKEACTVAINSAKAQVYSHTRDIWLDNMRSAQQIPNLLLPPVIPQCPTNRAGE